MGGSAAAEMGKVRCVPQVQHLRGGAKNSVIKINHILINIRGISHAKLHDEQKMNIVNKDGISRINQIVRVAPN